jgi:two-component system, OmpR family, phosphate regulon sensor histidine kinase PhoR
MASNDLRRLAALIRRDRDALLADWREKVRGLPSARSLDAPTLNDHLPLLLEELAVALDTNSDESIAEALAGDSPLTHGLQRLQDGYDIAEVVAEYNIMRGSIHDLATANMLNIQGKAFHILNRVLDGAIGLAVDTFATQRALEVQQRRDEYLAFVAHDLRTPLSAVALATRVLEVSLATPSGAADSARMIGTLHRNVRSIEAMVGKVLEEQANLGAPGDVQLVRRAFELWPLVENLVAAIHPEAGTARTRLINEVPDALEVFADAQSLRRILQNLIGNALGYTPDGEVRIGARALADGSVECWVADTGPGIPPELIDRVFEKGESDPGRTGRTGLGLAIVKAFVEAHGGTVSAESPADRGATIRFTLAAAPVPLLQAGGNGGKA